MAYPRKYAPPLRPALHPYALMGLLVCGGAWAPTRRRLLHQESATFTPPRYLLVKTPRRILRDGILTATLPLFQACTDSFPLLFVFSQRTLRLRV